MPDSKKRKGELTKEQIDFRKNVLKIPIRVKKEKYTPKSLPLSTPLTNIQYMNNCMVCINEFDKGGIDKNRVFYAASMLRNLCQEFINEHK